jgi:hypothetical protein
MIDEAFDVLYAAFLEKVAQKAAFRETRIPPGTSASGMACKDRAQGPRVHFINALRRVEALCFSVRFSSRSALNQ